MPNIENDDGLNKQLSVETDRFQLFLWLWFGALFSEKLGRLMIISDAGWPTSLSLISTAASFVVLWSLCNRTSVTIIIGVTIAQALVYARIPADVTPLRAAVFPFLEHWYLATAGNLILLTSIIYAGLHNGFRGITLEPIARFAAGGLRIIFCVFLMAAGFSKVNSSFFTPHTSCVTRILEMLHAFYVVIPNILLLQKYLPYLVVFVELICPVLLLVPRLRRPALLCIFAFLFGLGILPPINSLYEFAGLFLAIGVLFIPAETVYAVVFAADGFVQRTLVRLAISPQGLRNHCRFFLMIIFIGLLFVGDLKNLLFLNFFIVQIFWCGAFLLLSYLVLISYKIVPKPREQNTQLFCQNIPWPSLMLCILIALSEGITFLGVQHRPAFKMASGLSVSRAYSNHLLISHLPDLGFNALAKIISSDDPFIPRGAIFTWMPLRTYLEANPKKHIILNLEGQRLQTPLPPSLFTSWNEWIGMPTIIPTAVDTSGPIACTMPYYHAD